MKEKQERADKGFRPLAGFWFLNISSVAEKAEMTKSFRPLAGFWFLNIPIKGTERLYDLVSVPLRGSGS